MTEDVIPASARVDEHGNLRSMDTPFEQGRYFAVIGRYRSDNPYKRDDKLNRRLWELGFRSVSRAKQ